MKEHQRQHRDARLGAEDHAGHGQSGGQGLLGAREADGEAVGPLEAQPPGAEPGQSQHGGQQYGFHAEQGREPGGADRAPHALGHALTEGGVDDEQHRGAVHIPQRALVPGQEADQAAAEQLPREEGRQQLGGDAEQAVGGERGPAADEPGGQQRGGEHAEQAGIGARADGGRHVAAGQRGEGDRGLDGGGDEAEEEQPLLELRGEQVGDEPAGGEPQQREDDEGARHDGQVQPPVAEPVHRLAGGQPRSVEEEEQADGCLGGPAEPVRGPARRGQQDGDQHGGHQQQDEGVQEAGDAAHADQHTDLRNRSSAVPGASGGPQPAPEGERPASTPPGRSGHRFPLVTPTPGDPHLSQTLRFAREYSVQKSGGRGETASRASARRSSNCPN